MKIRIIGLPGGDTPEDVQRAWIGLEMEAVKRVGANTPRCSVTYGVQLSKEPGNKWSPAYLVERAVALRAFKEDKQNPDERMKAWHWFDKQDKARRRHDFLFDANICERVVGHAASKPKKPAKPRPKRKPRAKRAKASRPSNSTPSP